MIVSIVGGIKSNMIYMGLNEFAKGPLLIYFLTNIKAWKLIPLQNMSDKISSSDSRYMCFTDVKGLSTMIYDCCEDKWVEALVEGALPDLHSNLQLHENNAPSSMWYSLLKKDVGALYIFHHLAKMKETSEKETTIIKVHDKRKVETQLGVLVRDHFACHSQWNIVNLPYYASTIYKEDYIVASTNY